MLLFRTQIEGPLKEESEDDLEVEAPALSALALGWDEGLAVAVNARANDFP
jgi:hypothetical protein